MRPMWRARVLGLPIPPHQEAREATRGAPAPPEGADADGAGRARPVRRQRRVAAYELSKAVQFHWLHDGDYSFRPRKASDRTEQENLVEAVKAVAKLAQSLPRN